MTDRGSRAHLAMSLLGFGILMILLLAALGFGVGTVELLIWLALVMLGATAIVRRHRGSRRAVSHGMS